MYTVSAIWLINVVCSYTGFCLGISLMLFYKSILKRRLWGFVCNFERSNQKRYTWENWFNRWGWFRTFCLPNSFSLQLYHGNLKTVQSVKQGGEDVSALVNPKMMHYSMVKFKKAADLCVYSSKFQHLNWLQKLGSFFFFFYKTPDNTLISLF
jgi:hypothetical protein